MLGLHLRHGLCVPLSGGLAHASAVVCLMSIACVQHVYDTQLINVASMLEDL